MEIIAVEEHTATEQFLQAAHALNFGEIDQVEVEGTRQYANIPSWHKLLVNIDDRVKLMNSVGQTMAVLGLSCSGDLAHYGSSGLHGIMINSHTGGRDLAASLATPRHVASPSSQFGSVANHQLFIGATSRDSTAGLPNL